MVRVVWDWILCEMNGYGFIILTVDYVLGVVRVEVGRLKNAEGEQLRGSLRDRVGQIFIISVEK